MPLDELTKLYNRRDLFTRLKQEVARTRRSGKPFSILMIDVDHFKEVNDNFGHLRGDRVLVELAQILRDNCREMDVACRYGGDEFVIILPETDRWNAEKAAQRLLKRTESYKFTGDREQPDLHLTVSVGIATFPTDPGTSESLLQRADEALYKSKKDGRNRISKDIDVTEEIKAPSLNFKGFVNRADELNFLKKKFDSAVAKTGSFVIVCGEAGIGKTRLVTELHKYSSLHKVIFLDGRPFEFGVTPPYHIFFQLVKNYFQKTGMHQVRILGDLQPVYKATLAKFLPDLRLSMNSEQEPSKMSPMYEKMRLFDATYRLLESITKESPLFLFLDDLQWVREADLELFGYLLRNISNLPVLICGAYRVEEIDDKHHLSRFMRIMSREHRFDKMELGGLSFNDTRELLRSILAFSPSEDISKKIYQETSGNPFYIEEIVKSLVDDGSIYWDSNRWSFKDIERMSLPSSIGDLLLQRLDAVDDDLKELLSQASVIGNSFSFSVLKGITNKNEGHLFDLLDIGIKKLLITAEPDNNYSFSNLLIQRTLYENMSSSKRRRLHSRIAHALEVIYAGKLSEIYENLAHHYYMSEEWPSAFDYNLKAAKKLKCIYANHDAITRYEICLDLIGKEKVARPDAKMDIYRELADVYFLIGEYKKAVKHYKILLKHDDLDAKNRAEIMGEIGRVYERMADFDSALACYNEGKALLDKEEDKVAVAKLDVAALWVYVKRSDYDQTEALADKTLAVLESAGCNKEIARIYSILGSMHLDKGEWDEAEKYQKQSLEYVKLSGDENEIATSMNNLGNVYHRKFGFEKAVEIHSEVLKIREKIGNRSGIATSLNNLAIIYDEIGEWEKCLDYHNRSLAISKSINEPRSISLSHNNIGYLLLKTGEFKKAADHLLQSLEISESIGDQNRMASTQNNLGYAYLRMGWTEEALKILRGAEESCTKYGFKNLLTENHRFQAELFIELNKLGEAKDHINSALEIARKIGDKTAESEALNTSGKLNLMQNKLDDAVEQLDKAMALAKTVRNDYVFAKGCYYYGLSLKKEDAAESKEYIDRAKSIFGRLGAKKYQKLISETTQ